MGMPETTGRWTRDMVLALPDDGNRYELFDGELLVTSAPSVLHQMAVTALIKRLLPYVPAHRLGQLLTSPADLSLDGEQLAQPDLFIAPLGSGPTPTRWEDVPNPILGIEILSRPPVGDPRPRGARPPRDPRRPPPRAADPRAPATRDRPPRPLPRGLGRA